ncbi:5'-methylthioadenosine/adenosylhomocysteine nucleosidase [Clostridium botulinum]|uniref:adenosylhomocysteine nucleosidase n=1 Tax=Clostridium botulinum TaxID=1491 RepID=A0A9Q1UXR4_CLOBO|nr:5'-methylthioadenosine/adenosylhomocysteine nucleosidase [Clostridium botulinum]AEB75856.1 Adenosylhomocysteine nucleosidase [Clostridium botulinum BKT015925]KEH97173.1 S-adenosylhomocysteine nucleosidase [Clostridium botulinum D str. 16868]KEI04718.1 S-adenosylhomocysteine nucleosidase [Clostridium botulinum C/D str. Sp77]KLU75687.1 S-adenosylhomocysteine nucleosidase [Clostridium botulinum V891]KOA75240.1 S-adenosylhomocysteine nucleosidase [Clostridium botulinum]
MIIGIIGAMDEEVEILLNNIELESKTKKANMEFNLGKLWGKDVVVVRSGIGKVNAAVCAQILVDDYKVDKMINVGVAGGMGKDIMPGDVVIADTLVQHDMDTTVFGDKLGQVPRLDSYDFKCDQELIKLAEEACKKNTEHESFIGRIVSGDQFIASVDKINWLSDEFNAIACEMEGASIAQVCYLNSVPFVVIRSISDNANNGAHIDYEKFIPIGVKNSTNILKGILENI